MSSIDRLGPGDMKLQIEVTGDEGCPMKVRKMAKMGKNGKFWKNRQKW